MQSILDELNPHQREAVEALEGPILVIAGAGSGKTRVITARIMHLVNKGISPYQLLAMTFTNKAALEMKSRVAELLGRDVRDLTVTTFHSFCSRFLRREIGYLDRDTNFVIYDTSDQTAVLKRCIRNMGLKDKDFPAARFRNKFSYLKNQADIDAVPSSDMERQLFQSYKDALREQNAMDFDDLLLFTVQILKEHADCRERYQNRFRYMMVDEYQDTNAIQAKLIQLLLNEDRNLCVVGDEDQSIYGWRGAEIRNILDFDVYYPDARIFKLEQNYRSTQYILDYANQVISHNVLRKPKKLWTAVEGGSPIMIKDEWSGNTESEFIIQNILKIKRNEPLEFSEFAVLFRSNFLSRSLEDMCRRYKVPFQLIGGLKFYDRKEIKDLLSYMRIVANPRDWTSFSRAIGVPARGVGAKSLDKLFALFNDGYDIPDLLKTAERDKLIKGKGLAGIKEFRKLYEKLAKEEKNLKPREWLELLISDLDYRNYLEKVDEVSVEDRVENVNELISSMRELEKQDIVTLAQFMDFSALVSDQDEFDEDQPKISLMTIHAAKGLEFDTVFVMGLEDGVFPNQRSLNDNPNAVEEERRLFYVAVTRARKRLFLTYARRRQTFGTTTSNPKSRFLVAPGRKEVEEEWDDEETWDDGDLMDVSEEDAPKNGKVKLSDLASQIDKMKNQLKERNIDVDFGRLEKKPKKKSAWTFRPGDTVRHGTFGIGTVAAVRGVGDRQNVTVYFPGRGKKTLVARIAKLEKVT